MKLIQTVPWLASTSLVLLGAIPVSNSLERTRGDELTFHSVASRKLDKRFVQHSELNLVNMKVSFESPDGPEEHESNEGSMKIVDDETIEFSDETLSAGDGQPKKLKRSFATIENSTSNESDEEGFESSTIKNTSGLLGKHVVFTWDADEKAFGAAWFECEGDDDLLKPMVEDADFRAWLPGKKVDEGDTWTIAAAEFNNLQEPSGSMGYQAEGATEKETDDVSDGLRANRKGEIKATFKGTRDEGGVKVGVIAFEGKLSSSFAHDVEQEDGPNGKQTTELTDELEGELLWDIGAGHFHSLTCDSSIKMNSLEEQAFEDEGVSFKFTQAQTFEGKKTYRFSCAEKKD